MVTLHSVPVAPRSRNAFGAFAARIAKAAKSLKRIRILHVNATPKGGGVAELLRSLVAMERAAGLRSSWVSIEAPEHFFEITKRIHNGLQGKKIKLSSRDVKTYREVNAHIAKALARIPSDLIVIHDPQPLGVIRTFHKYPMIARIHIDCSKPDRRALAAILPELDAYECVMFSHEKYVPRAMDRKCISISAPAIDAETEKNKGGGMKDEGRRNPPSSLIPHPYLLIKKIGIDPTRPLAVQISRFDPWKNPLGVIKAYHLAKKKIPGLQLVMMGIMAAQDDPEALGIYREIEKAAKGDKNIHLLAKPADLKGFTNDEVVSALQSRADVVLQLSTREGFGLTATEAMWKGAAVIGGPALGIRRQIENGKNGFIAKTPEDAARLIVRLVNDDRLRARIGLAAHRSVARRFLMPRMLLDHLKMYGKVRKSVSP
jgi:trehalose synthase